MTTDVGPKRHLMRPGEITHATYKGANELSYRPFEGSRTNIAILIIACLRVYFPYRTSCITVFARTLVQGISAATDPRIKLTASHRMNSRFSEFNPAPLRFSWNPRWQLTVICS